MTDFSAAWLDLREGADHRSRNDRLARSLGEHFAGGRPITIVDLGCGTGSNLRATAPLLCTEQNWVLVDREQGLLAAATERLKSWADAADQQDETLVLLKGSKRISVSIRRADLAADLPRALGPSADLVAASALFDLVSPEFIARLAAYLAHRRCAFYSVLTFNGDWRWTPRHEADALLLDAFNVHQRGDKGFGPAAGAGAADLLSDAFSAAGHCVEEGDSAWRLGPGDAALIAQLAADFAAAAQATGGVDPALVEDWRALPRTAAVVGHTDILALPRP
jgi:hypothetical protein